MYLKLGHKILLLISVPLAFILVVIGLFALVQRDTMADAVAGSHSVEVLAQSRLLFQTMDTADDDKREFLLTGKSIYAARSNKSIAEVRSLLGKLQLLVNDNPEEARVVDALAVSAYSRLEKMKSVIVAAQLRPLSDFEVDREMLAGNQLMETTREAMALFTEQETQVRDARQAKLLRSFDLSSKLMVACGIAAFGLTFTLMVIFSRGMIRRIQNLGSKAERFAKGEPIGPQELRPADDEIGRADQAFHRMATVVAERQEALTRYRLLSEAARDIIIFARKDDLTILEANDAAVKAYGYDRAELVGMKISDLRMPGTLAELADQLKRSEQGVVFESTHRRKDGSSFPVEVAGQSAIIGDENVLLDIVRDLSERKHAQHERETFFDASPYMMCIANLDGYFMQLNPAWERTLGFSLFELRAITFMASVHPEDRDASATALAAVWTGKSVITFENRYRRKDGSYIWVSWSAIPSLDEGLIYAVGHDVTQRKRADEELAKSRDQAMEASRVKSQFLANMSHEIRTPMNGIVGTIELLTATHLDADQRDYADIIKVSGTALLAIVNQILDLSKLEAGKVVVEAVEFSPVSVVESVAVLFAPQARVKDISIQSNVSAAVPRMLRGDVGHLRQVLLNIAGNAVKFTERGKIDIRATVQSADATSVVLRISVTDTGIGLSPQTRERLFEPFTQADMTTTRKYGGTGLGLSISKHMVELMDGEIGVESTDGKGSAFWFTARFERSTDVLETHELANLAGLRPLVIDPDPTSRGILHQYMAAWGMRSGDGASTKDEGIDALRRALNAGDPFQIVIVEDSVALDGDFARIVSQDPELSETKLILMRPMGAKQHRDVPVTSGFASYLSKPIRQSYLFDSITAAMNQNSIDDQTGSVGRVDISGAPAAEPVYHADQRILLAEDNRINQRLAAAQFKKLGIEADLAINGREAVAAAAIRDYALVLMDCQMPEMDGFAATRAIRKAELSTGFHVPIIAMTANAMDGDRESCVSQGMDDYLSKPVDLEQLRAMLNKWIPEANEPDREDKALV